VDKSLDEEDREILDILGVNPENVKRTMFTFSFKEQTHHLERGQLELPKDKFLLLVVGWRLDNEIDDLFLRMLEHVVLAQEKIGVAFMGKFDSFDESMTRYPALQKNSYYLGMQEDALAVTECCDLYVNPERNGGGSSVAEALYKGLPAVTLPIGDVSVAAGKTFWVADYDAMERQIQRYCSDENFYAEMSQTARKRAENLLDSEKSFGEAIRQLEREIS
jgi:glycosyltransferase involved in cell wall biosynthesis